MEKLLVSTIIIVSAALTRHFAKNRLGYGWTKVLWGITALWLLLPVSFSFERRAGYHQEILLQSREEAIEAGYTFLEYMPEIKGGFREVPIAYFVMIFAAVVAVMKILYHYRQYGFAVNRLADSTAKADGKISGFWEQVCREENIRRKIPVYCGTAQNSPMIIGCFSPALILPKNLLGEREDVIHDILRHEAAHYRAGDLWYKRLMLLVSDLYWYDPFVYRMRKLACEDVEFTCDRRVTKSFDDEEKRRYCNSILNLADAYGKPSVYAAEFSVDARRLKTRIENVFDDKKTKKGIAAAAVYVIVLLAMAGMVDIRTVDAGIVRVQGEEDIRKYMNAVDMLYFNGNEKLGEVRISFMYGSSKEFAKGKKAEEFLHVTVACEKYDELSDMTLEGIRAVYELQFGDDVEVRVVKLEP
ncbi:MAG: M56 family metallopeptidase [Alistipes sp.]|nr:M56 family metallopeptidase [Alistipes sp.]